MGPTSRSVPPQSRHATPTPSVLSKRAASTASATVDTLAPVSSVPTSTGALLKVLPLAVPMPVALTLTVLILVPATSVSKVTPCPASVALTSTNVTLSSAWPTHCAPTLWALSNASATKATKWRMACALISTSATPSTVVPTLNASTTQAPLPVCAKRVTAAPTPMTFLCAVTLTSVWLALTTAMQTPHATTHRALLCASVTLVTPVMVSAVSTMTSVLMFHATPPPPAPTQRVRLSVPVTVDSLVPVSNVPMLTSARLPSPNWPMVTSVTSIPCALI